MLPSSKTISSTTLWIRTIILSIFVFISGSLYLFIRRGNYDLYVANKVFATTALILIGLSFALSGICYFWNFADSKIVYRKDLGLSGFAFAIVHIIISIFFLPNRFPYPQWMNEHWISALFGTVALIIFSIMAAISNNFAMQRLGVKQWKLILRTGYVAYTAVIVHFAVLKYTEWIKWFTTFQPLLPPLSLFAFVFSVGVIVLRISMFIDRLKHK